jgi:nitrile hydratase
MNGIHDLGGMHGFGTVEREVNEPLFHAAWERTVLAVQLTALRKRLYNLDELRHGIERMPAAEYLGATYYERWLAGISRLLVEKGILKEGELEARAAEVPEARKAVPPTAPRPAGREEPVHPAFDPSRGHPFRREANAPARFAVGDAVLTKHFQPAGHTRLARYARGKRGVVDRHHGCFVFPDTNAHAEGEDPDHVYSVRFEGPELWGKTVEGRGAVYIDLWESYLESAG